MANFKLLFHLIPFLFLIFILLAPIGHAKRNTPNDKNTSPFDFIKKLKGCHKGNHTKEVHELKAYLEKFGYLKYPNGTHANDDEFDETLESAVKTYQKNYHIKPSGIVDDKTISTMTTTRCGVPDIVNGTNYMQLRHTKHDPNSNTLHTVAHFSFFPGSPRWPLARTQLTYRFPANFPAQAIDPAVRAFQKWDAATRFSFVRVQANQNSDLVIEFHRRQHGDGAPFDGPGGVLAHAFSPQNGRFHYDGDERWSPAGAPNAFDLETVAIHEIGHLLGLGHSSVREAIMFASIPAGVTKNLHADDINGINALYR